MGFLIRIERIERRSRKIHDSWRRQDWHWCSFIPLGSWSRSWHNCLGHSKWCLVRNYWIKNYFILILRVSNNNNNIVKLSLYLFLYLSLYLSISIYLNLSLSLRDRDRADTIINFQHHYPPTPLKYGKFHTFLFFKVNSNVFKKFAVVCWCGGRVTIVSAHLSEIKKDWDK